MDYENDYEESPSFYSQEERDQSPPTQLKNLESNHSSLMKMYQEFSKSKSDARNFTSANNNQKQQQWQQKLQVSPKYVLRTKEYPSQSLTSSFGKPQQDESMLTQLVENYKIANKELSQKLDDERAKVIDQLVKIQGLESDVKFAKRENARLTQLIEQIPGHRYNSNNQHQFDLNQQNISPLNFSGSSFGGINGVFATIDSGESNNNINNQNANGLVSAKSYKDLKDSMKIISDINMGLQETNAKLESKVSSLVAEQKKLNVQNSRTISELEKEISELQRIVADLKEQQSKSDDIMQTQSAEITELTKELSESKSSQSTKSLENSNLTQQNTTIIQENIQLAQECSLLKRKIKEMEQDLNQKYTQVNSSLEQMKKDYEQKTQELTNLDSISEEQKHQLNLTEKEAKDLKLENEKLLNTLNALSDGQTSFKSQAKEDAQLITSLQEQLGYEKENSANLNSKLHIKESEVEENKTLIEKLTSQNQNLTEKLEVTREAKQTSIASLVEENTFLQDRLENALKQNELYSAKLIELSNKNAQQYQLEKIQKEGAPQLLSAQISKEQSRSVASNHQDDQIQHLANQQQIFMEKMNQQAQTILELQEQLKKRDLQQQPISSSTTSSMIILKKQEKQEGDRNQIPHKISSRGGSAHSSQKELQGLLTQKMDQFDQTVEGLFMMNNNTISIGQRRLQSDMESNPQSRQVCRTEQQQNRQDVPSPYQFSSTKKRPRIFGQTPLMSNSFERNPSASKRDIANSVEKVKTQPNQSTFYNENLRNSMINHSTAGFNSLQIHEIDRSRLHADRFRSATTHLSSSFISEQKPSIQEYLDESIYTFSPTKKRIWKKGIGNEPLIKYKEEQSKFNSSAKKLTHPTQVHATQNIRESFEQIANLPKSGHQLKLDKSLFQSFFFNKESLIAYKKSLFVNKTLYMQTSEGLQIGIISTQSSDENNRFVKNLSLYFKNTSTTPIIHLFVNHSQIQCVQGNCKQVVSDWILHPQAQSKQDIKFQLNSLPTGPILAEITYQREEISKQLEIYLPINILSFLEQKQIELDRLIEKYLRIKSNNSSEIGFFIQSEKFSLDRNFAMNQADFQKYLPGFILIPNTDNLGEFLMGGNDFKLAESNNSKHLKVAENILHNFMFAFSNIEL